MTTCSIRWPSKVTALEISTSTVTRPGGDRKHERRIAAGKKPWHDHLTGKAQLGPSVALENDDDGIWPDRGHPIESHRITGQLGTKPAAERRLFARRLGLPPRRLNLG